MRLTDRLTALETSAADAERPTYADVLAYREACEAGGPAPLPEGLPPTEASEHVIADFRELRLRRQADTPTNVTTTRTDRP